MTTRAILLRSSLSIVSATSIDPSSSDDDDRHGRGFDAASTVPEGSPKKQPSSLLFGRDDEISSSACPCPLHRFAATFLPPLLSLLRLLAAVCPPAISSASACEGSAPRRRTLLA